MLVKRVKERKYRYLQYNTVQTNTGEIQYTVHMDVNGNLINITYNYE